jgi:hypothetical protein
MRGRILILALLAVLWPSVVSRADAQMISSGVSQYGVSSRFYERTGVSFGFGMCRSSRVRFGARFGPGMGVPMFVGGARGFGGWSAGGLRAGWSVRHGRTVGHLGFSAYQSSHRSLASSSAFVTGLNGYPMSITDTVTVPFVVGIVPIGSYGAYMMTPLSPYGGYGGYGGYGPYGPYGPYGAYGAYGGYGGYGGYGQFGIAPTAVGLLPYRSWSDPWWHGSGSWRGLDRSYPSVAPRETLGDRLGAVRRQAAFRPSESRSTSSRGRVIDTSVRGLSSAAFRQLGGRKAGQNPDR